MRISIIGCGNMGSALVRAWLRCGICKASELILIEKDAAKLKKLKSLQATMLTQPSAAIKKSKVVVLAVKPQDMLQAVKSMSPHLTKDQVILSVMAGIKIAKIKDILPRNKKIVRCIPNLPALIGKGITAATATMTLNKTEKAAANRLLTAIGECIWVKSERKIDQANALSGCGPGYIYYLLETLEKSAWAKAFQKKEFKLLLAKTIQGSVELWLNSGEDASKLKQRVASKKGTTQAALDCFEKGQMADTLLQGIQAAFKRALELSRMN